MISDVVLQEILAVMHDFRARNFSSYNFGNHSDSTVKCSLQIAIPYSRYAYRRYSILSGIADEPVEIFTHYPFAYLRLIL